MNIKEVNHQILLVARPKGMPKLSDFAMNETTIPQPKEGEVLVETLTLSVDPYMRGRMYEQTIHFPTFQLNQPPTGGGIGRVVKSNSSDFKKGDVVHGYLEWSDFSVVKSNDLQKIDPNLGPVTTALGVLGMPGMTAYFGLLDIGKPKKDETVVVSGAAGAVGTIVGQIAKIKGCRVVGIAGSDEKANYLINELGFDAAINYKNTTYIEELKKACPNGVDVYFDNVGGDITDQVLMLINKHARIVLCGQISMYNLEKQDFGPRNFWILMIRSVMLKGFIIDEYYDRFPEGIDQMALWIKQGKIKYRENIQIGLANIPRAFLGLFHGENIGKQLVTISDRN